MTRMLARLAGAVFLAIVAGSAGAHEVRPAYLDVSEAPSGTLQVSWRQPMAGEATAAIAPRLSGGWLAPHAGVRSDLGDSAITRWTIQAPHAPLAGQTLVIQGLDASITDVLAHVRYANGVEATHLIRPDRPEWRLPSPEKPVLPVADYLALGVNHIWTGLDHLAYLVGLMLLVGDLYGLIKTVTAFTAAHSITLSLSALGVIDIAPAPVEAVIALSILCVAVELVRIGRGTPSLVQRQPWLVAFPFGLLHGLGFAGALHQVGLPPRDIPGALICFNLGIEAGQMAFVLVCLAGMKGLSMAAPRAMSPVRQALPYLIGPIASFWLIERTVAFL